MVLLLFSVHTLLCCVLPLWGWYALPRLMLLCQLNHTLP
jgi:hypothetical protein